jgi:hypothetical protein
MSSLNPIMKVSENIVIFSEHPASEAPGKHLWRATPDHNSQDYGQRIAKTTGKG